MRRRAQVKVCGITDVADAQLAAELGADFLGFIFYPGSPRAMDWGTFEILRDQLPSTKRVYVQVRPQAEELERAKAANFDFFQLHFPVREDPAVIERWAQIVGPDRLWLAPKIPPADDFPESLLEKAATFLVDTYRKDSFGGTGETGDWRRFRQWSETAPEKRWVLAGGLKPENIEAALEQSGASVVDVSSGIEERPGKKDHARMKAFFAAMARTG